MNWGTAIFLVIVVFISGILTLVFKASGDQQQLVTDNYYEKELKYQEKIEGMHNVKMLSDTVLLSQDNNNILINFPAELKSNSIEALVHLYCAFDEKNDKQFRTNTSNGMIILPMEQLIPGPYTVKMDWTSEGKVYYSENKIQIK